MSKQLLDLILSQGFIEKSDSQQLLKTLPPQITAQTIPMLRAYFLNRGIQQSDVKEFLESLFKVPKINKMLSPFLDQELFFIGLTFKLCKLFQLNPKNNKEFIIVQENIEKRVPIKDTIKNIYRVVEKQQISQQDLEEVLAQFSEEQKTYDKLVPVTQNMEIFDGLNLQDIEENMEELIQDLKEIPSSMDEYQLKKAESEACNYLIENKKEPTSIRDEFKEYLEKLEIKDEQARKSRESILKGKDIRRNLKILRYYQCGIDIQDVFRMVRIGREIRFQNERDKVILFMGLSRAGKTTLITRLMGYEMMKTKINGIYTLQPNKQVDIKHKELKIGYSNRSTTRYPSIHDVPEQFLVRNRAIKTMDSPGFEDTVSIEVEISNRITTIEALKKVSNLYIVIVINQKNWGVAGTDIEKLATTVSSIIKKYEKVERSIKFVFNQFESDFAESLSSNIKDLRKNIKSRKGAVNNENFDCFFEHFQEEAKNKKNFIDPKTVDQKEFINEIFNLREIENPGLELICDIGIRGKEEIRKLCDRFRNLFFQYYKENKIEQVYYCINMLQKMGQQKQFDADSDFIIREMNQKLKTDLQKKREYLSTQFMEMTTRMIPEYEKRKANYQKLETEYKILANQIQRYKKINKEYVLELESIVDDVIDFFETKMQSWKGHNEDISNMRYFTRTALEFAAVFASPSKSNQINELLKNLKREFRESILQQFKELKTDHQVRENYCALESLEEICGKKEKDSIGNVIMEQINNRITSINLIDLRNIKDSRNWQEWIKPTNNMNEQISKIQVLLKSIKVVLSYPKEMIKSEEKQKFQAVYKYVVDTLPRNMMYEFEKQIQVEDDDDKGYQMKQKIRKIKQLITWMKQLNKINAIREYHDNRLQKIITNLILMVESLLNKFTRIGQLFIKNNIRQAKISVKRGKSQFRQLQELIQVTGQQQLINKFQELKRKLSESFQQLVKNNFIERNMNLKKMVQLKQYLQSCKNLSDFKKSLFINPRQLQKIIEDHMKEYQKKIQQPLISYQDQIELINKQNRLIRFEKLQTFINYLQIILQQSGKCLSQQFYKKLDQCNKTITNSIKVIFNKQIIEPMLELQKLLNDNLQLETGMVQKIQQALEQRPFIKKIEMSLQYLNQLQSKKKIMQYFEIQNQHQRLREENQRIFQQINANINHKFNKFNINTLDKIKVILSKLKKFIEDDSNLMNQLYEKLKTANRTMNQKKQFLFKQFKTILHFEEQFIQIYKQMSEDQTQNGKICLVQLRQLLEKYRRHIQSQLKDQQNQLIDGKLIAQFLTKLNKLYLLRQKLQQQELKDWKLIEDKLKISGQNEIIQFIDNNLQIYLDNFQELEKKSEKQLNFLRSQSMQIQRNANNLIGFGVKFPKFILKKNEQIKTNFATYIQNTKKSKKEKITKIEQKQEIKTLINGSFIEFYNSLEKDQQQKVKQSITEQFSEDIKNLKNCYQKNYKQYTKQNQTIDQLFNFLPKSISKELRDLKDNHMNKIKEQINNQLNEVSQHQIEKFIKLGQKIKLSQNEQIIKKLKSEFTKKFKFSIQQKNIDEIKSLIKQNIWKYRQQFQKLQIFNDQIVKIQQICLNKINKYLKQCWDSTLNKYQNGFQSDDDFSENKSRISQGRVGKSKIQNIMETYEFIYEGYNQKSNQIINKKDMKKNFQYYLELIKKTKQNLSNIADQKINEKNRATIEQQFKTYQLLNKDLKCLKQYQKKSCNELLDGLNIIRNLKQLDQILNNIKIKVNEFVNKKFVYYERNIINQSSKDQEKRINDFEEQMKYLDVIMNGYNRLNPDQQIIIEQLKQSLVKEAKESVNVGLRNVDLLANSSQFDGDNNHIESINYLLKLFETINSKNRTYMPKGDFQNQIIQKLEAVHSKLQKEAQEKISQVVRRDQNLKQDYKELKYSEQNNIQTKKRKITQNKYQKIKQINKNFDELINNSQGEQKEKKIKEKESEKRNIQNQYERNINILEEQMRRKLGNFLDSQTQKNQENIEEVKKKLIALKKLSQIFIIQQNNNKKIDQLLQKLIKSNKAFQNLFKLLNESSSITAGILIEEHQAFKKRRGVKFNIQTSQANDIGFLVDRLRKSGKITNNIGQQYSQYYKIFDREQNEYIEIFKNLSDKSITNTLKTKIKNDGQLLSKKLKNNEVISGKEKVILLAKIFALWSILSPRKIQMEIMKDFYVSKPTQLRFWEF